MKTLQIHKNAKYMIHTASKVPRPALSIILILMMQKTFSRNSLAIISLMMTRFSAASSEIGKVMEVMGVKEVVCLVILVVSVKVCLTMMIFSMEEVASQVHFQAILSRTEAASLEEESQNQ